MSGSLFDELKRRRVFRATAAYVVVAAGVLGVAEAAFPALYLPAWALTFVVVLALLGLPVTIALSWAFDIRPEADPPRTAGVGSSGSTGGSGGRRFWSAGKLAGAAIVVALVGGAAMVVIWGERDGSAVLPPDDPGAVPHHTLAVLPFGLVGSESPEDEAFAAGVHDDLLSRLAKINALRVTSRTSVLQYASNPKAIPQIARELGVEIVLEGQIQRAADRVRLNVQLIDAATDHHMWAETYSRPFNAAGLFELQAELTTAIADALHARLLPEEMARVREAPTDNLAAWQLVRDAAELDFFKQEENEAAIRLFERAVALDSGYAAAFSGLAVRYFQRAWAHGLGSRWTDSALVLADHALDLDPGSTGALSALGLALAEQGRLSEARTAYQRALAIEMDPITAHNLALTVEVYSGRLADAIYWAHVAALTNPLSPIPWWGLATVNAALGRLQEAREYAARAEAFGSTQWLRYLMPLLVGPEAPEAESSVELLESGDPRGGMALGARAMLSLLRRDTLAFLEAARRYHQSHPHGYERFLGPAPHVLGTALAYAGRAEEARPLLEQGLDITTGLIESGYERPNPALHAAQALALLGHEAEAAAWLDRAYDLGFRFAFFNLYGDPAFAGMREVHDAWLERIERDLVRLRRQADARVAALDPLPPPPEP